MIKNYFIQASKEWGESVAQYYEKAPYNYVIIEGETPICWDDNNCPIIFGDRSDAIAELNEWSGEIKNISIITEKEFIDTYCKAEIEKAIAEEKEKEDSDEVMLTYFMNPYNSHNKNLVLTINRLWKRDKRRFRPILIALYDRDLDEIYDSDAFDFPNWRDAHRDKIFADLQTNWEDHAYNYLMHIADDRDLETIIGFIRGREFEF